MAKQSITNFKSNISSIGFARSNIFEATINPPGTTNAKTSPTNHKFYIKAASLPASNIGTIGIPFQGRVFNVPGDRTFDAWSTTIINSENLEFRKFLESWVNDVQDNKVNLSVANGLAYQSTLEIKSFMRDKVAGESLKTARHYKFHNCFPTSVSAIDLDFASNDAIEEFTCEWQYSHWTVEKPTTK